MSLCSTTKKTSQVLEAMKWYFGETHCREITFVNDVASNQQNARFTINAIDEEYVEKKYLLELLTGAGTPTAAPSGVSKIDVTYTANDTASTIAGLVCVALEAEGLFKCEVVGSVLHAQNLFLGEVESEDYTNSGDIAKVLGRAGFGGSIGAIAQGGGTLSTEQSLQDIFADDTADLILDQIFKGASVGLSLTLAEMHDKNWENLIGKTSGDIKEVLASKLVGFGTSKLYNSSFDYAGRLVGHPVRLPHSDRSKDICIWKTLPLMDEINYSGQDVQGASFSFAALNDFGKPEEISLMARGDHSLI